jgi:tetratricopeptide (TPR) repeat protein
MRGLWIGLALALGAAPAWAQTPARPPTQQQHDWCFTPTATDDQTIDSCTAHIQSGRETSETRAFAYDNRGFAYINKGLYDQAIADETRAIELKPDYFDSYNSRGFAYEKKGLRDPAIADYRAALNIKPSLQAARVALTRLGATP